MRELHDEPLGPRTTLGIGGPARRLLEIHESDELIDVIRRGELAHGALLGGGSNLVVADAGFDGTVLQLRSQHVTIEGQRVSAEAGLEWDVLVARCVAAGLAGLECLSGIPGHVGATPMQNVGAYGQQVSDCLESVEVVHRGSGERRNISAADCALGYRDSAFKGPWRDRYIVTKVRFELSAGPPAAPRYGELSRALETLDRPPSLQEVRDTVLSLRRAKGMVSDAEDADSRSAGSFFVNPTLDLPALDELRSRARERGLLKDGKDLPHFEAGHADERKVAAAWLIEGAGFARGHLHGSGHVGLSSRHALAIVNRGGGTAEHVHALASEIQREVWRAFGVALRPEPVFLGLEPPSLDEDES